MQTRKKIALVAIPLLLAFVAFATLPLVKVLSIEKLKKPFNTALYSREALKGFVISYTHSVNKGRVYDYYICQKDGSLKVDKTVFVSYGAGIMEPQEAKDAVFSSSEDAYTIAGINRKMKRLVMAVGLIAEHAILIQEKQISLKDVFGVQTPIVIEIKKISYLAYLAKKI